jgi:hypothetical protein
MSDPPLYAWHRRVGLVVAATEYLASSSIWIEVLHRQDG